ncbi:thioredoxin domain-containing protein [Oryzomonas japonica]|uniref:Thioredoxin domain-containing protein n=1 Tax=Oryzomonas japonica TaxID=2603858 RepID=A0A7J4ZUU3_9BACT|nr:thioredoxin domain-containing protein [Oryzomonas japonica]KAB0666699.1 thioredoxin domain-containing protein [Oryzomonas japonica]
MANTRLDTSAYIARLRALDKGALPPNGGQGFNRLIFARSPYLLQHAENPVAWYEWGDAAFEKARDENRPVLLSIGYATCHWCHVMAHESFEDEQVAALLNNHFVCIKVDREERPDIDDFYMTVSQVLTGSGGWPLNIFMTPDKRPFMAVTYLPRQGREGQNGMMELLPNIAALWRQRPDLIEKNCRGIMDAMDNLSSKIDHTVSVDLQQLADTSFNQLRNIYDPVHGGFGTVPKFPMPMNLSWLIGQGATGNHDALGMALHTLERMRRGGIWDHMGSGLHRYAVDRKWLVPHFEKMLYDQAMVGLAALEANQVTGDDFYLRMAENIFSFVARELTSPEGGFYAALDADSEGVEGKCYVWDKEEIEECLGDEAPLFCRFYGVTDGGNFEGHTILNTPLGLDEFCTEAKLDPAATGPRLERCRLLLLEKRERRIGPFRDEKIITAWNGLMIAALARGGAVAGDLSLLEVASRAASFLLERLRRSDGRLLRSFLGEAADIPGFLEDYAFLAFGLLELFEATLDTAWLEWAVKLADQTLEIFLDPGSGRFLKTGRDAEAMPLAASLEHDGVVPSAFSLTAQTFIRLARAAARPDLLDHARRLLESYAADVQRQPTIHLGSLHAMALLENEPFEARFSGQREHPAMLELLHSLKSHYCPNLALTFEANDDSPALAICALGTCYPTVRNVSELEPIMDRVAPRFRPSQMMG